MYAHRQAGWRLAALGGTGVAFALLLLVLPSLGPVGSSGPATMSPAPQRVHASELATTEGWVSDLPGTGSSPSARYSAALAYDPVDGYSVLFGGCNRHLCPLWDTWKYDAGNWSNLTATLPLAPSGREGAVFVYDAADGYLLLFGGIGPGGAILNDSWRFSDGAWTPIGLNGPAPPARAFAQATYDGLRGVVLLFGGVSASGSDLEDTWTYANGIWTNLTSQLALAPAARAGGVLAFDPVESYSVLFGGTGACGGFCGDTWAFGPDGWANLSATQSLAPYARVNTTFTFDEGRSMLILFGGSDGVALSDTWGFANGSWQPLTANLSSSPTARYGAAITYDGGHAYLLLFGGASTTTRSATWLLLSPLAVSLSAVTGLIIPGTPINLTAAVQGGLGPYNSTWQFGDGSVPTTGTRTSHTFQRPGTYLVLFTVTDAAGGTATSSVTLLVQYAPLNITIRPSTPSGSVGASLTFTALVSGGAPPYVYAWSAPAGICSGGRGAALLCDPSAAGVLQVSVGVSDASGQSASVSLALPVEVAPGGGNAASPSPGTALGSPGGGGAFPVWLAIAIGGAAAVGAVAAVTARHRRRVQATERPLCYAVPAWSETPPEFKPQASSGEPVESWSRVP